jgi:Mor family transcriptional regulator
MHGELANHIIDEGQPTRWPRTLATMIDAVDAELTQIITDPIRRYEAATRVIVAIAVQCGGKDMYLPRGTALKIAMQHAQIWRLSADQGWPDWRIAEWAKISERGVRKIIAEQRALRIPRVQGSLELVPAA